VTGHEVDALSASYAEGARAERERGTAIQLRRELQRFIQEHRQSVREHGEAYQQIALIRLVAVSGLWNLDQINSALQECDALVRGLR
jgi:hypothetical protein